MAFLPMWFRPRLRLIDVVVLPMPALVAEIDVTRIRFDFLTFSSLMYFNGTLAM